MSSSKPFEPEVFIAKSVDELINAAGSKYCPVPVNAIIKRLLLEPGRYALVGLPCHIEGIRKAEITNPELARKVVFHFGLFCHHAPTFGATYHLMKKINAPLETISRITYRANGWPGQMTITLKNESQRLVKYSDPLYWGHIYQLYFCTPRCFLCSDKVCSLSDFSFGDAWRLSTQRLGESVVIARSTLGMALLSLAKEKGKIVLKQISNEDVASSQSLVTVKRVHNARMRLYRTLGKKVPTFSEYTFEPHLVDYIATLRAYMRLSTSSIRGLEKIMDIYPALVSHIQKHD